MKSLAIVTLLIAAVPVRAEDDPKKVLESLQGEWKMVGFIKEGRADSKEQLANSKAVVKGNVMTITAGKRGTEEITFSLDPKATPPAIDFKSKVTGERFVKGIYKLDKDKLTICYGLDSTDRPKQFKSEKGSKVGMFLLERVKK